MAFPDIMTPFLWGKKGQITTPEQVARERGMADVLAQRGSDTSPVGHWSAGAARLVDALNGTMKQRRADEAEAEGLAGADSIISALMNRGDTSFMPQQPAADPGVAGAFSGSVEASGQFPASLIKSESGGNWGALNSEGYGGRLQFGAARLADAARAGLVPAGTTGAMFSRMSPEQQKAVENWHFADIDRQAEQRGLNRFLGQNVGGVSVTQDAIRSMAHLGGIGGAQKFLESGGGYNPADSNGTSLLDYGRSHGGASPVASIAGAGAPSATGVSPIVAALMQAQGNPWVAQKYGGILDALMQQEMGRQNSSYEMQMKQLDPMYQAQLQSQQLQNQALMNPPVDPWANTKVVNDQIVRMGPDGPQIVGDYRTPGGGTEVKLTTFTGPDGTVYQFNPQTGETSPLTDPKVDTPQNFTTITGEEALALGLDPKKAYNRGPDGKISEIGNGGVTVNNNLGGASDDELFKEFAKLDAKTLSGIGESGMQAKANLGRIDRLESLLAAGPSGAEASIKTMLGDYGIETSGLDTLQAARALINAMVPEQRQPGSGPMSDADLELFKQSLPRLINSREGNALIIHTLRGIAQYDEQRGAIVQRMRAREITSAQAFEELQTLQNPLAGFNEQSFRFDAPAAAPSISGADWQDVNGTKIRRRN